MKLLGDMEHQKWLASCSWATPFEEDFLKNNGNHFPKVRAKMHKIFLDAFHVAKRTGLSTLGNKKLKSETPSQITRFFLLCAFLVGGFNPSEKYESKWVHLPQVGMWIKHFWSHPVFFAFLWWGLFRNLRFPRVKSGRFQERFFSLQENMFFFPFFAESADDCKQFFENCSTKWDFLSPGERWKDKPYRK